jgi:hypothetical protein
LKIALVGKERRLLCTVTDVYVRRGIFKGIVFNRPASDVMNPAPAVARVNEGRDVILQMM